MDKLGVFIFTSISVGAAGLGVWQVGRYHWKVGIIDDAKKQLLADPVPFDGNKFFSGRRVTFSGIFDHENEVLIGPRSVPVGVLGPAAQGMATNPQGYLVVTPFRGTDGSQIFVNRGWVPRTANSWTRPHNIQNISAIVSQGEKANTFSPLNTNPDARMLLWLDMSSIISSTKSQLTAENAVLLEIIADPNAKKAANNQAVDYPVPRGVSSISDHYVSPATHTVYAVTWFSLAAAGMVMTYYKFRRPRTKFNVR